MKGTLYLCSTPIGNLEDITLRVLRTLKEVDIIAAEDTRHTLGLLNHFQIHNTLVSYHEHNKREKGQYLIEKLLEGKNIALVTDAGMPGISDPGADMVRLCRDNNILVTVLPGAVAAVTALVLSGFDTRRYVFEGFLPYDKKERRNVLETIKKETRTIIFYEAPHHLLNTLNILYENLGNRKAACVRELTKKYEDVKIDTLQNFISFYSENSPKGEFVIVLEGISKQVLKQEEIQKFELMSFEEHLDFYVSKGMSQKDAIKQAAKDRGITKREFYSFIHKNKG